MTDCYGPAVRSRVMRAVKSRGNRTTETLLARAFRAEGITGWRRNQPLFGKPDFLFRRGRIAVFADGCFWHGHDCRNTRPRKNARYWREKIRKNRLRDKEVTLRLRALGWKVVRFWECEIKRAMGSAKLRGLKKLLAAG